VQAGHLILPLGLESGMPQRGLHRPGSRLHPVLLIGEQIHILSRPGNNPVGQQRVPVGQREPLFSRRGQRDGGHPGGAGH